MARWTARARTAAALLAVVALAALFRLYKLDAVPPGLYLDEVLSAQHALGWRVSAHKAWFAATPLLVAGWVETSNGYLAAASGVMCRTIAPNAVPLMRASDSRTMSLTPCVASFFGIGR